MQLPKAIKDLALNSLKKTMLESNTKEGRFFINEKGELDAEMVQHPDYFVRQSQVLPELYKAAEMIKAKNSEIATLKEELKGLINFVSSLETQNQTPNTQNPE